MSTRPGRRSIAACLYGLFALFKLGSALAAQAPTVTTLVASPVPAVAGQEITFTAVVVPQLSGTPTGIVIFTDTGTGNVLGAAGLSSGLASFSTALLAPVGLTNVQAAYQGDPTNAPSSSLTQVNIFMASSTTTVISSLNPAVVGQAVTFLATVQVVAPSQSMLLGNVTFMQDGAALGTVPLNGVEATFVATPSAGGHAITATYLGDAHVGASTGVLPNGQFIGKGDTAIVTTSSQNPSSYGQPVTFTAHATAVAPAVGTPNGTVTFMDGGSSIGTANMSGATATFTTSLLNAGSHAISVVYNGDSNFNTVSGNLTDNVQIVDRVATTTTLSTTCAAIFVERQPFTFSANVGGANAGGSVTFYAGATPVCTSVPLGSGSAACSVDTFAVNGSGTADAVSLTAAYSGDINYASSISSALGITVLSAADVILRADFETKTALCPIE